MRALLGGDGTDAVSLVSNNVCGPSAIAVDSNDVFWASYFTAADPGCLGLAKYRKSDAQITSLASSAFSLGLAISATTVYWTDRQFPSSSVDGTVWSVSRSGGTPALVSGPHRGAGAVQLDSLHVYWLANGLGASHGFVATGQLYRAPLLGGAAQEIYYDPAGYRVRDLAVGSAAVFLTLQGQKVMGITKP